MINKPEDTFLKVNTSLKTNTSLKIKSGLKQGMEKGWTGFIWLLKIIIPISFATNLMVHFGIIQKLDFVLAPAMHWLSLPASAAIVIIMGFFTGIYGTVAALSVMPFCTQHVILIAVFSLIAHNLIQESMVQGNSGINPFFAAFFRLFIAFVTTFICAKFLEVTPETGNQIISQTDFAHETVSFTVMLKIWGVSTFKLIIQIFCIIMPLMVIMELAKIFHIITFITRMITPVLKIMGLSPTTGMLWLTAGVFGLAYGAAVIVEETQTNDYEKHDLNKLHISIGINHAMIEDSALLLPFIPIGLPLLWLWIPRLAAAIIAVWIYSFFLSARRFCAKRAVHKKLCNNR